VNTFSIVTVCYNDDDALVPTIRSVLAQRFSEFEYVIQDGGSADDSTAVVAGFGDWIDLCNSAPDDGIYQAMNRAVKQCSGRYTLFINAADLLISPTVLSEAAEQLTDGDDVVTGHTIAAETGSPHKFRPWDTYWAGMTFDHQAAFVRTELLKQYPFDETLRISGDFDFFSRLRLLGATFRSIPLTTARKPYAVGASSDFMARFRERYGIALRHFGDAFPVQETLTRELVEHIVKRFDAAHLRAKMDAMAVDALLSLYDQLAVTTSGKHRLV
jgi:glycosyltransferase involved in cell wall biosynthesis